MHALDYIFILQKSIYAVTYVLPFYQFEVENINSMWVYDFNAQITVFGFENNIYVLQIYWSVY